MGIDITHTHTVEVGYDELCGALAARDLKPLWKIAKQLMPEVPLPTTQVWLWKWDDVSYLLKASGTDVCHDLLREKRAKNYRQANCSFTFDELRNFCNTTVTTKRKVFMSTPTIRVAIAYHSGFGHTAKQAEAVARGAASVPGVQVELHHIAELSAELWVALDQADAIIFGAPTYMGSPSAVFKAFAEGTSKIFADNMRWKDKIAAGFTNSQTINGDKLNTLVDFVILAAQHGMHWVNLGLYAGWDRSTGRIEDRNRLGSWLGAMAQSNADAGPEIAPPKSDLETAEALGHRVALVTQQWVRGHERSAEEMLQEEQQAYAAASLSHEHDHGN